MAKGKITGPVSKYQYSISLALFQVLLTLVGGLGGLIMLTRDVVIGRLALGVSIVGALICLAVMSSAYDYGRRDVFKFPLIVRRQKGHFELTGAGNGIVMAIGPLNVQRNRALDLRVSFKPILRSFKLLVDCPREIVCDIAIVSEAKTKSNIYRTFALRERFRDDARTNFRLLVKGSAWLQDHQWPGAMLVRIRYSPPIASDIVGKIKISLEIRAPLAALWCDAKESSDLTQAVARVVDIR